MIRGAVNGVGASIFFDVCMYVQLAWKQCGRRDDVPPEPTRLHLGSGASSTTIAESGNRGAEGRTTVFRLAAIHRERIPLQRERAHFFVGPRRRRRKTGGRRAPVFKAE